MLTFARLPRAGAKLFFPFLFVEILNLLKGLRKRAVFFLEWDLAGVVGESCSCGGVVAVVLWQGGDEGQWTSLRLMFSIYIFSRVGAVAKLHYACFVFAAAVSLRSYMSCVVKLLKARWWKTKLTTETLTLPHLMPPNIVYTSHKSLSATIQGIWSHHLCKPANEVKTSNFSPSLKAPSTSYRGSHKPSILKWVVSW